MWGGSEEGRIESVCENHGTSEQHTKVSRGCFNDPPSFLKTTVCFLSSLEAKSIPVWPCDQHLWGVQFGCDPVQFPGATVNKHHKPEVPEHQKSKASQLWRPDARSPGVKGPAPSQGAVEGSAVAPLLFSGGLLAVSVVPHLLHPPPSPSQSFLPVRMPPDPLFKTPALLDQGLSYSDVAPSSANGVYNTLSK